MFSDDRALRPRLATEMNITLFQYKPNVSAQTLLRHHRITRWITYPCIGSWLFLFSSVAQSLMFGFDPFSIALQIASLAVGTILIIPTICCVPWIQAIEKELMARSIPIPGGIPIDKRSQWFAVRLMGWFAIIVIVSAIVRRFTQ